MKTFNDEGEVIRMPNDSKFSLMASVSTSDINRAVRVSQALEAGTVCINTLMAVSHRAAFGGHKQSVYGSENGLESVLAYTQMKPVLQQLG